MRIWLEPDRMAAYRVTVADVEDALRKQNLEVPAGRIESQQREFSVTSRTDLNTVPQFAEIALKQAAGYTVRLRDVARVEQSAASERSYVRLNGVPSISTGIIRNATANPLEVSQGVRDVMPQIQRDIPPQLKVIQANDNAVFIDRSIKAVYTTVAEAVAAGGAGGVRVPAHAARLGDSAGDHSRQPDRLVCADGGGRFHDQHADAAGAGAGHRPGRR